MRWKSLSARLVVPDTNLFLQADAPFETIDWHAALESQRDIRLVVPLVVVHELDRLKRQGNSTTARLARAALRWLAANLPADPNGPPARVAGGGSEPQTAIEVYVQDGPSRPEDADGVIIKLAQQLGRISGRPTVLVTRDLGMRVRAVAVGVNAVQLPEPSEPPNAVTASAAF
jgi:predicted ribonuclease YlaK